MCRVRITQVLLIAFLAISMTPESALGVVDYPDNIPGYQLSWTPGSVSGSVDDVTNPDDVFTITLYEGEVLTTELWMYNSLASVSSLLYGPWATDVYWDVASPWDYSIYSGGWPDIGTWWVPAGGSGDYHINVWAYSGASDYDLYWQISERIGRISGIDRFDTAVAISNNGWTSSDYVVIATGRDFPDALSASGVAGCLGAPLLLVDTNSLPSSVADEIARLGAHTAVIVGGSTVVGPESEVALTNQGLAVTRISGADRYATSAACADFIWSFVGYGGPCIVARGDQFADALSAASTAYAQCIPILLTRPTSLPEYTSDAISLNGYSSAYIVGGTAAVSVNVAAQLGIPSVRIAGADRYATSRAMAEYSWSMGWTDFYMTGLATGTNFPDALAGGVYCGSYLGSLILSPPSDLSGSTAACLADNAAGICFLRGFGGEAALSASVLSQAGSCIY